MTRDFWCLLLLSTSESLNQVPEPLGTLQNAFFNRDMEKMPHKCKSPAAPATPHFTKPHLKGSVAEKISSKLAVKTDQSLAITVPQFPSADIFLPSILSPTSEVQPAQLGP